MPPITECKIHPLCSRYIRMYPLQNRWTVLRYLQCYENFSECCTHLILPETALFSPTPTFAKEPIFKALSDPVRREILLKLKQKRKMSAGEIAAEFDLTNATISYHLSTLKKADLIFETRYQKYIYYEINTSVFESVVMWLMQFQEDKDESQK